MNPVSVLANATIDRLITDPAVRATLAAAMLEVRAVAGALGLTFDFTLEQPFDVTYVPGRKSTRQRADRPSSSDQPSDRPPSLR